MSSLSTSLLLAATFVVLLWFALGTQRNIKRGNDLLRWLQGGLPAIGRRTTVKWLGSSTVTLNIGEARKPFADAQVVVVLEPRDLPWLWALSRRRGRRDFLILRGRLRSAPGFELEAAAREGWTARDRMARLDRSSWMQSAWGDVDVALTRDAADNSVRGQWDTLEAAGGGVWRLSVRREHPHVEVHTLPPSALDEPSARALIDGFCELGRVAQTSEA